MVDKKGKVTFRLRVEGNVSMSKYMKECEQFLKLGYDGRVENGTNLTDTVFIFEKEVNE